MHATLPLAVILLALGACGDEPAKPVANGPPDKHPETRKLEAADAAGYDGQGLRNTVDRMLDKRQEQDKQLEDARKPAAAGAAGE